MLWVGKLQVEVYYLIICIISRCHCWFCSLLNAGFRPLIGLHFLKSEKRATWTWLISAVLFGMAHGINILNGGAVPVIAMQMVGTTFMAIYFVALFMRTGSIIVPILVHSIWDFICVATEDTVAENLLMVQPTVDLFLVGSILTCIALGIVGIVLINKGSDSIKRIWDEKWTD